MMWGFIGWSVIALALVVIGIVSWNSEEIAKNSTQRD